MPRNRAKVDRQVKLAEILDAADAAFLGPGGYRDTTIAAIAAQAGIATNSVHWYFPTKDDLLVAVLRRRLEAALPRLLTDPPPPLPELVIAGLHELDGVAVLTATVHDRAAYSAVVDEFHSRFHELVEHVLQEGFQRDGLTEQDARAAAGVIAAVVEGLHLHNSKRDPENRDQLVLWALRRFQDSSTSTPSVAASSA